MERRRNYSIHCFDIFVLCISRKKYWLLLFKDTETISWTQNFFFLLVGVPLGHQEYAVTRASSTNHFHDHLSIIGSMCTSTSVYICLHEFQYSDSNKNRFQTISQEHQIIFSLCFFIQFIMVCIFEILFKGIAYHIILMYVKVWVIWWRRRLHENLWIALLQVQSLAAQYNCSYTIIYNK